MTVAVVVNDGSSYNGPSGHVTCTLYKYVVSSGEFASADTDATSGTFTGQATLHLSGSGANPSTQYGFLVGCVLPDDNPDYVRDSSILALKITEED